jgi:tetratricopeptide (TPR) repeat protein
MSCRLRVASAAAMALAAAWSAPALRADTLCLKDGRIIDGKTITRDGDTLHVRFDHGEVVIPQALVLDVVIDAEAKDAAKSQAISKKIADRKAYIEQVKALSEWRNRKMESTKHFDFESTVPPHIFTSYRDLMEAYFTDFQKKWKVDVRKEDRLKVCFYGNPDMFHQVGGVPHGVLGYFTPWHPYELNVYYDRLDETETIDTMFHEANHYLQKLLNVEFDMPHFPGESLAEYYGASTWDDKTKKLTVGLIQEGRLAEVQIDVAAGKMMSLETMISSASDNGMYEHYTWGWSLVHFLMNRDKYAAKFQRFVTTLATGKDVQRSDGHNGGDRVKSMSGDEVLHVFMKCLELKDKDALKALEKEWHGYVTRGIENQSVRGFEEAGLRALHTPPSRPLRARMLLQKALDGGTKNPHTWLTMGELCLTGEGDPNDKPDTRRATEMLNKAIELDPLVAEAYYVLGSVQERDGKKDEAKRLRGLAHELDPDNPRYDPDHQTFVGVGPNK